MSALSLRHKLLAATVLLTLAAVANANNHQSSDDKGLQSMTTDINNAGSTVGYTYQAHDKEDKQAVMWIKGKAIPLNEPGKNMNSEALAINNVGQEAGFVYKDGSGIKQAVLWNGTKPTLLGSIGEGTSSVATDINDKGFAVGFSSVNKLDVKAVLWKGKKATVLKSLGGTVSKALGINDLGQIVGYSYTKGDAKKEAVMWDGSRIINLNSYLTSAEKASGWILQQATAINDNGSIIGQAYNTKTGKTNNAFEINAVAAVPEPTSSGMLLAGLGMIGLIALRRKSN